MDSKVPLKLLELLTPVNELSQENLQKLLDTAQLVPLESGSRLTEPEERDHLVYVVKGDLYLASSSGAIDKIQASSPRAKMPVFCENSLARVAVFKAPGILLKLDRKLFLQLLKEEKNQGLDVQERASGETETTIFQQIYAAYEDGSLELPAFPEVAARVRQLLDDPDTEIQQLVDVINTDPSIAGQLLKVANSAMYRGTREFDTVRDAVVRLGMKVTAQIVSAIALGQTFTSNSAAVRERMHKLWEHSVKIATLSMILARSQAHLKPERAQLAGLLHDIGEVPILNFAGQFSREVNQEELDEAIKGLKDMVGVLVINHWKMGTDMATVVAEAEKWQRDSGREEADYCDLVVMAQILDGCVGADLPPLDTLPTARKLGLDSDEKVEQLMEENAERIDELIRTLMH